MAMMFFAFATAAESPPDLCHGERRGHTIETRLEIAVVEIEPTDAPQDHRCLLRVRIGAQEVERALVASSRELALARALGAMRLVEERADCGRVPAARGSSRGAGRPHQRRSRDE